MIVDNDTIINDVCREDLIVTSSSILTVNGICTKVILHNNSKIIVKGICNTLEIATNCTAEINGIVNHLVNYGALTIYGIVDNLEDFSKNTHISSKAIVNNS